MVGSRNSRRFAETDRTGNGVLASN